MADIKKQSEKETAWGICKFIDMYGPEGAKEKRRPGPHRMTESEKGTVEETKSIRNVNRAWGYDLSPYDVLEAVRLYRKDPEYQWDPRAACGMCYPSCETR